MQHRQLCDNLIIFDCDGTLVDSEYLCNFALEVKLHEMGVKLEASVLLESYRGWKLARILQSIQQIYRVEFSPSFETEYRALVAEFFASQLQPVKHIESVLQKISSPMCVASSGPREKIKQSLSVCKLLRYFDPYIYSAYEVGSWKPEPDLFLHAAQAFAIAPELCLVVEDSEPGIAAANRANMQSVFFNPHGLRIQAQPSFEISSMLELQEVIQQYRQGCN